MLASISRGALPVAPGARQQRPVRRVVAASWPAAALGSRSSVAARLAHQLQQLKQFKVCQGVWVVLARLGALASRKCSPTPSPRLLHAHPLKRWFCMPHPPSLPPPVQVWDVSAPPSERCTPAARGGRQLRPARQGAPNDGGARPGAGGGRRPGIVWFRGDLRLHDNEALTRAQVCWRGGAASSHRRQPGMAAVCKPANASPLAAMQASSALHFWLLSPSTPSVPGGLPAGRLLQPAARVLL